MSTRYKHVKHRVRIRPHLKSVRTGIHAEYRQALDTQRGMLEEQSLTLDRLRAELQAEWRITLKQHVARWWREGPWPQRWRTFISR